MVTQVTGMSRNGVSDWIIQRVTALVLAAYTLCILGFIVISPVVDYATWSEFIGRTSMQVFTMLALVSTCAHAWIGMWTVGSDYLREHTLGPSANTLRTIFQIGCILIIAAYFLWGVEILWGNHTLGQ